jgi:NADP-dependent 3-hydroxy acid dehydrogenase YdfG
MVQRPLPHHRSLLSCPSLTPAKLSSSPAVAQALGQATYLADAAAGAGRLVLIGRRENKLEETKAKIKEQLPKCEVETYSASTIKAKELKEVADKVKGWDVLVLSAGRAINPKSIEESDPDGWWDVMEVRVPSPLDLSTHHH